MTNVLDSFQRIYVINLPTRTDRCAEIAEQLERVGSGLKAPNVCLFPAIRPDNAGDFPSIGAHGCFLSHLGVLRDAAAAGLERILIFEDDLNFTADFLSRAPAIVAKVIASDCAMFYGGHEIDGAPGLAEGCTEIPATLGVRTAHFVAIQGPAIGAAADYLAAMLTREPGHRDGGPMHVDGAYSWFRRVHPEWPTFVAVPQLGYQRSSRTDIHALRWFDKTPGVRSVVARMRRIRNVS